MKNIKGSIVLFDSVCTGGGIAGFLKIILDWCNEEKLDISARVKIVNFNYRMREIPVFDAGNPLADYWSSMSYTLVTEHIWRDFSYNHIQTASNEHFFFPPWAWEQKQLWEFLPNQYQIS